MPKPSNTLRITALLAVALTLVACQSAPPASPAPAPVAQAAPPPRPPTPPSPPAPPAPPKRCDFTAKMSADSTFIKGKNDLAPAAKEQLDKEVLTRLAACSKVEAVIISVHGDRVGNARWTQQMTEKRANAISAYLVAHGVQAPLEAMGMGKTAPAKSCVDPSPRGEIKTREQLNECLAPNRRVQIDVRGLAK